MPRRKPSGWNQSPQRSSHRVRAAALLVCVCLCSKVAAQDTVVITSPIFDAATIKPIDSNVPHTVGVQVFAGGRVVLNGLPLKTLISIAFRMSPWQIAGAESWSEKDAYNIEATPAPMFRPKDMRYTLFGIEDPLLCEMLQMLLIERFQVKAHRETKIGDVYALERSGKPLALRTPEIERLAAADAGLFGSIGYAGGIWTVGFTSMPQLAKFASDFILHAPVIDRTGLKGYFDYKQRIPDLEPNYLDNTNSFLRLIPELGLRLEHSKGPIEILVIDHAEKPSPN